MFVVQCKSTENTHYFSFSKVPLPCHAISALSCNCTSYLQDIQRYIWESIQKCTVTLITSFNFIFDAHTQIGLKHTIIMLPCVHHAYVLYFFRLFFHLFSKLPFFRLSCRRENDRMLLLSWKWMMRLLVRVISFSFLRLYHLTILQSW